MSQKTNSKLIMNLKCFLCLLFACFFAKSLAAKDDAVQVLIWDERQPRQSEAYDNFLGNEIATRLGKLDKNLEIRSVAMDDPEQGVTAANLDWADVMIWWGHARQAQVTPETAQKKIVSRIKEGKLDPIFLHSAHWTTPFMEAMNERTKIVAKEKFPQPKKGRKIQFQFIALPFRMPPDKNSMVTPAYYALRRGRQIAQVRVDLPNCCFPGYRPDGKPSTITVKAPDHPIAKGLPKTFQVKAIEMYNEPFHVARTRRGNLRGTLAHRRMVPQRRGMEGRRRQSLLLSPRARNLPCLQATRDDSSHRQCLQLAGARVRINS